MKKNKLLTFEFTPNEKEIEIHLNEEGLRNLIYYLDRLLKNPGKESQHNHLMTRSWAGHELTEEKQGEDNTLINKVTIRFWV